MAPSSSSTIVSTTTPLDLHPLPSKSALVAAFVGKRLNELRTPALILDKTIFESNCERVTSEAKRKGLKFRLHVKTHKTIEGVRIQVTAAGGVPAVICSTLPEVWQIVKSGVIDEGLVNDILYSLPPSADKLQDIALIQDQLGSKAIVRLMVDHPTQIQAMSAVGGNREWNVFIKVDGGGKRAGNPPDSAQMGELLQACKETPNIKIHGFYSHFGQSYASKSLDAATEFYHSEISCVNAAAKRARSIGLEGQWVLSVGATPTAHAAVSTGNVEVESLEGELELHAGCYCLNDLQQLYTSLISESSCGLTVLTRIISSYPHRDELMTDCGALAVSKDLGPHPGYGKIVWPDHARGWDLGRVSQEHGTLTRRKIKDGEESGQGTLLEVGELIRVLPQHACLVCASFPWIYVVEDGGEVVKDVWVTWKGW